MEPRRTSAVELLWDLVFVFAVTQVTTLMADDLTWTGFGHGLIVLALVWWAWSAYVWAANAEQETSRALRVVLLTGMVCIFVAGLCLPEAFGDRATLFACSYAAVRLLHLAIYAHAAQAGNASWSAITGFAVSVGIGMALLVAGSFLPEGPRAVVWAIAVAIDYAGPAWLTRERLRGLQEVAVVHFAERYGLFIIICLGESIVAIGLSANGQPLDAELVLSVALGLVAAIGLWWTYFDRLAGDAEEGLRGHPDPVLAAADGYSYMHLVLVAGIMVFAVGMKVAIHDVGHHLPGAGRLAVFGGVALYLVGCAGFAYRLARQVATAKLAGAAALAVLLAIGGGLSGIATLALTAAVLTAVCAAETLHPAAARSA